MAGRPRMKYKRVSDAFDGLRSAGGILLTACPDEYLDDSKDDSRADTPLSNAWSDSVDAMFAACSEVEKLLRLLAEKAGLPPPDSNLSEPDDQPVRRIGDGRHRRVMPAGHPHDVGGALGAGGGRAEQGQNLEQSGRHPDRQGSGLN